MDIASSLTLKPTEHHAPMINIRETLGRTKWFDQLQATEKKEVLVQAREIHVPAGGYLIRAGEAPKGWFGVMEGLLKWSSMHADGRNVAIAGLATGSWFGESSLVRDQPYDYFISALSDSRLVLVPEDVCKNLLDSSVYFSRAVMEQLAERVNLFAAKFTHQSFSDVDSKIASTIASLYHEKLHPQTQLHLKMSQEELAGLCGVSRQSCNGVLRRLQQKNLIQVEYAGVTVVNLRELRAYGEAAVKL
ncbi:Crp/Fnr family transcriptional regulator [Herbaspirillum robiniae]|uniref:Crp/Fnr family transcriptional regulator n=1 Tax=Herbaspirillum robiniae TaxID=2014887 RepID=UPI003D783268